MGMQNKARKKKNTRGDDNDDQQSQRVAAKSNCLGGTKLSLFQSTHVARARVCRIFFTPFDKKKFNSTAPPIVDLFRHAAGRRTYGRWAKRMRLECVVSVEALTPHLSAHGNGYRQSGALKF